MYGIAGNNENAVYRQHKENADKRLLNRATGKKFNWVFKGDPDRYFEPLAKLSAAVMIADGHPHPDEWKVCRDICSDLGINWDTFRMSMEKEITAIRVIDKLRLHDYTLGIANSIADADRDLVFEAILFIVLADGYLTIEECELLEIISSALNISVSVMLARVAMLLREEEEIVVDIQEELLWKGSSYISD
jgi:tellurite resistance protein